MKILVVMIVFLIKESYSITSIKTYSTVELKENVAVGSEVMKLMNEEEFWKRKMKILLLNLSGFETNYFELKNERIVTKYEIDREDFLRKKSCFDYDKCLIELHLLINNGEEYWIIPIHLLDENDNRPEFHRRSIEMKLNENEIDGYKIPFEGAKDLDEKENGKIFYLLDCSKRKKSKEFILNWNETTIDCLPLFDLIEFTNSILNQYDQLGLIYNPSKSVENSLNKSKEFVLYAFNFNQMSKRKEMINSMKIFIQIENSFQKIYFKQMKFFIKNLFQFDEKKIFIGNLFSKLNFPNQHFRCEIFNKTNENIQMNSNTSDFFLLRSQSNEKLVNDLHLFVQCSFAKILFRIQIQLFIRLFENINRNLQIDFENIETSLIQQSTNQSNRFILLPNSNERKLFDLQVQSKDYPNDEFLLSLDNFHSFFSLSSLREKNKYSLIMKKTVEEEEEFTYLLIIRIKHQLTNEYLSSNVNLTLISQKKKSSFEQEVSSVGNTIELCIENQTFTLFEKQSNQTRKSIANLQVIQTKANIFSFSTLQFLSNHSKQILIDDCQMTFNDQLLSSLENKAHLQICSFANQCYQISSLNTIRTQHKVLSFRRVFKLRPIEITILTFSFVFIISMLTIMLIICRLRGFNLCLAIKNYLFYGKKYGINHAQRLSNHKITERIHSIVIRESQSPHVNHTKSIDAYIYHGNQYADEGSNVKDTSCPSISSSIDRTERRIAFVENDKELLSKRVAEQENNYLLDLVRSDEDGGGLTNMSHLASEV